MPWIGTELRSRSGSKGQGKGWKLSYGMTPSAFSSPTILWRRRRSQLGFKAWSHPVTISPTRLSLQVPTVTSGSFLSLYGRVGNREQQKRMAWTLIRWKMEEKVKCLARKFHNPNPNPDGLRSNILFPQRPRKIRSSILLTTGSAPSGPMST